ncbi:hypothetical protein D3C72_1737600 [compost metagenome]
MRRRLHGQHQLRSVSRMARKAQGGGAIGLGDGQCAQGAALFDVILDFEVAPVHFHAFAALADEHAWRSGAVAQQQAAGAAQGKAVIFLV